MKRALFVISLSLIISCSHDEQDLHIESVKNDFSEIAIIPQEQALTTLRSFMDSVESEMLPTKSGKRRQIVSVDTYYVNNPTKSVECIPATYVVNFEDNEGFAVLGANSNVADIVAVTESGNIDPVTFAIRDSIDIIGPALPFDPITPDEDSIPLDFDWYCEQDDDYFICSPQDPSPIRNYLMQAVHTIDGTGDSSSGGNDYDDGGDAYDKRFRVITYNRPSVQITRTLNF